MAPTISWVGPTTPPGLLTRTTTAFTAGFSACSRSSRTAPSPSRMMPSISTTAIRAPPGKRPVLEHRHEHPDGDEKGHEEPRRQAEAQQQAARA